MYPLCLLVAEYKLISLLELPKPITASTHIMGRRNNLEEEETQNRDNGQIKGI